MPLECSWYDSYQHGWCVRFERSAALLSVWALLHKCMRCSHSPLCLQRPWPQVTAVCTRWRRLCREVHGLRLNLYFLKDHPRVQRGDSSSILAMLVKQWRWVDAVDIAGWKLTHSDVAMLLEAWPTLTTIRCCNNIVFLTVHDAPSAFGCQPPQKRLWLGWLP